MLLIHYNHGLSTNCLWELLPRGTWAARFTAVGSSSIDSYTEPRTLARRPERLGPDPMSRHCFESAGCRVLGHRWSQTVQTNTLAPYFVLGARQGHSPALNILSAVDIAIPPAPTKFSAAVGPENDGALRDGARREDVNLIVEPSIALKTPLGPTSDIASETTEWLMVTA